MPFWWMKDEHKWMNISLLIEMICTSLSGERADKWDMIIYAFSKNHPLYSIWGIDSLLSFISEMQPEFRFPWWNAYKYYNKNIAQWYIEVDDEIIESLPFSKNEINYIKYEW